MNHSRAWDPQIRRSCRLESRLLVKNNRPIFINCTAATAEIAGTAGLGEEWGEVAGRL